MPAPATKTNAAKSVRNRFISSNADVLPPGQGRAVGVDVEGFRPVGSDALFGPVGC